MNSASPSPDGKFGLGKLTHSGLQNQEDFEPVTSSLENTQYAFAHTIHKEEQQRSQYNSVSNINNNIFQQRRSLGFNFSNSDEKPRTKDLRNEDNYLSGGNQFLRRDEGYESKFHHHTYDNRSQQYEVDLDASTANNNSIVILLNNQDAFGSIVGMNALEGGSSGQPMSDSNNHEISQETIIPSFNQDPPITLEEALFLVSGQPDKYVIKNLYFIVNLLSMTGFMVPLSMMFLFQTPKLECFN